MINLNLWNYVTRSRTLFMQSFERIPRDSKDQMLFKILIIGDVGTGKTSIVRRYVHNLYSFAYKPTIGVDFAMKVLIWDVDSLIRLHIWDISGQDRFGTMTRVYYKDAHGAIILFDPSRKDTYAGALKWKADLDNKLNLTNGDSIPTILLASKCDLLPNYTQDQLDEQCKAENFITSLRSSSKENFGLDEAFKFLVGKMIETMNEGRYDTPRSHDDENIRDLRNKNQNKKLKCC